MDYRDRINQFFLDTCDPTTIEEWAATGLIAGVTTNPLVLAKAGFEYNIDDIANLANSAAPLPICVQVTSNDPEVVLAEAEKLAGLAENIVVKVPITADSGDPLITSIAELTATGVRVNATACMTALQAVHAFRAGARYVSLLYGRIRDTGGEPLDEIRRVRAWSDATPGEHELVVGSIRAVGDLQTLWDVGPHAVTVPPAVLEQSLDHPHTRLTVQEFVDAAGGRSWR